MARDAAPGPRRRGRKPKPLDLADGPAARFAWELRCLRQQAGNPTFSEMAKRALASKSSLSAAARGEQFPTWEAAEAFVRAVDGNVDRVRALWKVAAREVHGISPCPPEAAGAIRGNSGPGLDTRGEPPLPAQHPAIGATRLTGRGRLGGRTQVAVCGMLAVASVVVVLLATRDIPSQRCSSSHLSVSAVCNSGHQPAGLEVFPTADPAYSADLVRNRTITVLPYGTGLYIKCFQYGQTVKGPWGRSNVWIFVDWTSVTGHDHAGIVSAAYSNSGTGGGPAFGYGLCGSNRHGW